MEPFLTNPPRFRSRYSGRFTKFASNAPRRAPMIVDLTPVKKAKKAKFIAPKRPVGRPALNMGRAHVLTVRGDGTNWHRSKYSPSKKAGIKINPVVVNAPRRRHLRRNPALWNFQEIAGHTGAGVASIVLIKAVPKFLPMGINPWIKDGAKLATAIAGGLAVGKFTSPRYGFTFAIVGASTIVSEWVGNWLASTLTPGVVRGDDVMDVGAFVDVEMPTEGSVMEGDDVMDSVGEDDGFGAFVQE